MESRVTPGLGADHGAGVRAAPERVGPYRILAPLGRGSTGVVFRAAHEETGAPAAVKTLRVADPADVACLRREIHALSRLHDPGVVEIRGQGVEAGMPWYAMELVEGGTIDQLWPSCLPPSDVQLPANRLGPALRALCRLCHTLAFVHGEGIVHRDLKPANILLRDAGEPVLVDFGFVGRFAAGVSRETLEVGGTILGSLAYMAPEQVRGEFVDARADLYALGCILYEAVTGRPPFLGSAWDVLEQQLHATPEAPSRHVADVPSAIESVILRLLAKDPHDRMGYATDVAAQLQAFAAGGELEPVSSPRMYLYRPEFAGRGGAVQQLDDHVRELGRGAGGLVFIAGESGVGKTRLAMEVTRGATADGFEVVAGQCVSFEGTAHRGDATGGPLHPLLPLLHLIADHCRERGRETADRIVGRRGKVLAAHEPALGVLPGHEAHPDPAPLPALAARERLVGDLAETLSCFAREVPTIAVIDDLQWADELTLHTLAALPAQFYTQTPLLVIGCYRSDEVGPGLDALLRVPHGRSVQLGRLDAPTVSRIASGMLAVRVVPDALTRFLAAHSEGNPFFVSEYLRMVVGEQLLVRSADSEWRVASAAADAPSAYDGLPLPPTVRDLVARRLDTVPADARQLADAAAVLGREFELLLASTVAELGDAAQLEASTQLLRSQIVEEVAGERLRFTHDKLREVALAQLPPDRVRVLHQRAARAIEQHYATELPLWYAVLARHWAAAGEDRQAAGYFAQAGEAALRAGASREARTMLARALELERGCVPPQPPRDRARWLRLLAASAMGTGDVAGVIEHASAALVELGESVPRSGLGWAARLAAESARLIVPAAPPRHWGASEEADELARCAAEVTPAHYYRSDVLAGLATSVRCITLAQRSGSPATAMHSYAHTGYVAGAMRVGMIARRCFGRVRALRDAVDARTFGGSLYFEAMYETGFGHWARSEVLGEESVAILEGVGDRQEAEIANTIVANALFYQGRFAAAEARCRTMLESARARGNRQHTAWGLMLCGRSRLHLGHVAEAVPALEDARQLLAPLDDVVTQIMCDGTLARAALQAGDASRAREVVGELARLIAARWVVPLAQCVDGVAALPEVALSLRARTGEPDLGAIAQHWRALFRFAALFPLARPAAWRLGAELLAACGRRRSAQLAAGRAVRTAARLGMRYEEARAHHVAATLAGSNDAGGEHRRAAAQLYADLGCTHHLSELGG